MSAFSARVVKWKTNSEVFHVNDQGITRSQQSQADNAAGHAWMRKMIGLDDDPKGSVDEVAKAQLKRVGDKAFGTPSQQVVDRAVPAVQANQVLLQEKRARKEEKKERKRAQAAPAAIPLRGNPARNAPAGRGLSRAA